MVYLKGGTQTMMEKAREKAKTACEAYRKAIEEANVHHKQYYAKDLPAILERIQVCFHAQHLTHNRQLIV